MASCLNGIGYDNDPWCRVFLWGTDSEKERRIDDHTIARRVRAGKRPVGALRV